MDPPTLLFPDYLGNEWGDASPHSFPPAATNYVSSPHFDPHTAHPIPRMCESPVVMVGGSNPWRDYVRIFADRYKNGKHRDERCVINGLSQARVRILGTSKLLGLMKTVS